MRRRGLSPTQQICSSDARVSLLGQGWSLPTTLQLKPFADRTVFIDGTAREMDFPALPPGGRFRSPYEQLTLQRYGAPADAPPLTDSQLELLARRQMSAWRLSHSTLAATSCLTASWERPETCSRLRRCLRRLLLLLHDWPSNIVDPADTAEFENARRSTSHLDVRNEIAALAVMCLQPQLVLCGHLHKRYRSTVSHENSKQSAICCLASVLEGLDAAAVFQVENSRIEEVRLTRPKA